MSKSLEIRQAIKDQLVAAAIGLDADDIIIERQAELESRISSRASKARNGTVLLIGATSASRNNPDGGALDFTATIVLSLWVRPVYQRGQTPEEDIAEGILAHLDGRTLAGDDHCHYELTCTGWSEVPDERWLVRAITFRRKLTYRRPTT